MRPREFLALALLGAAAIAQADPSDYGKVDTFQPGKKYNCVPTADRKGWDCKVTGAAEIPSQPAEPATPPPTAATASSPAPAPQASALPGYLTRSGANQIMQPMPAASTPKPAPKPRVKGPMLPTRTPAPVHAPAATSAPIAKPASKPASSPAPAVTTPTDDFLALPADAYVIELAHAATEADLAAPNPAHEKVYKLHLRQNGADIWLLVCGPYDSLPAARAAREELATQGAAPGWPRRIGPLQTEMRRRQSF